MAILNSIRKRGIFLILIIAMALFAFILSDVLTRGGGGGIEDTVATVNGIDIPRQEFAEQVDATQRGMGPNASSNQAVNMVWERELRRVLIEEQYEKLGLTAGADQLNNALGTYLASNPTFQDATGQFSEIRMQEYVADIKANNPTAYQQWLDYVKNTKETVLQNTYLNMLRGGLISTNADGEQAYRFENDKVNIEYVHIPYTSVDDSEVTVSDAEITAYIKDHPKEFEVEPMVDIQYISFEEEPSEEDIAEARTGIEALLNDQYEYNDTIPGFARTTDYAEFVNTNSDNNYNDRWWFKKDLPESIADTVFGMEVGDIYGPYKVENTWNLTKLIETKQMPDSAKVRHILIPTGLNPTDSITRTDEQAKKTADSILDIVKRSPSKFKELVGEMSSDVASIKDDGVYDYFGFNAMVPEFRDFAFGMSTGDKGVVKTRFGYHIIDVLGQKNLQKAVKVATITKEIEASEETMNDVFSRATTVEIAAQSGDFTTAAQEQGMSLKPVNRIGEMDSDIPGIGPNRTIVNWAFNEETNVGDIKRFNVSNGYVIAQLTRKNPKGLMSLSEASPVVTPILKNKKKAEKIRSMATGTTLQEVASAMNVTVQTADAVNMANPTIPGAGSEPKVVGAAFGKAAGETTGLIEGKTGVFKVRVLAVNKAPDLDNYASWATQLNAQVAPGINNAVYNALKNEAEIEDNRSLFY
jgi:peptidyl-prolyl cis-trans isomerase D